MDTAVHSIQHSSSSNQPTGRTMASCYRCGKTGHVPDRCHFKTATCHSCGKLGYIATVCRSRKPTNKQTRIKDVGNPRKTHNYLEELDSEHSRSESPLYAIRNNAHPPLVFHVSVDSIKLPMELDTGTAMSIISEYTKNSMFPEKQMHSSGVVLRTYTAETVPILGELEVDVAYGKQNKKLSLLVVQGSGPSLIDREWMSQFTFDWVEVKYARVQDEDFELLLNKYPDIFKDELGTMHNFTAQLDLQMSSKPKFYRP